MPIGLRYYFERKKQVRYYLSALALLSFNCGDSRVDYYLTQKYHIQQIKIRTYAGFAFGPGMSFGRLGADLRYTFNGGSNIRYSGFMLTARFRVF